MGIFDKVKKTTIESRRYEEKLYEVALEEVEAGERRKGLYSKALAKADGDTEKADGIYLKLRVQSIMDDIESEQIERKESKRVLEAIQALESEEESLKEPKLIDFGISKKDIENLDKAYGKASENLLIGAALFSVLIYTLIVFSNPKNTLVVNILGVLLASAVLTACIYFIVILPRRYFVRESKPEYLKASEYKKALKKYKRSN